MLLAFTAVMAAAIFIGGIVVWRYMSDVKRDLLAAVVAPQHSDDEADAAATNAIRLVSRVAESFEEKLRRERTAMLGIRTGVDSRLNSQSAEIESIRALLAQMKADNSSLKGELGEIRAAALNAPKPETKPVIAGSPLQFLIKPRDGVPAATWRLPLPE
ncbi:MAG: hypothetical protein FJ224_02920 [Lentisphaerae bacterium]|nr:hypothetical protein [Lentisphaerota bacterium]